MQSTATKMKQPEHALITPTPPKGEEERVAAIFAKMEEHLGFVPDGLKLFGMSPPLLEGFVGNIGYFAMGGTALPPELTAMIRYLVSWDASCQFCVDMNEGFLSNMGVDLDRVRDARGNPDKAPFDDKDKALLKIAVKSVNPEETVSEAELNAARKYGWGDREIFDAVVQAANNRSFNHVLRTFNIEQQGVFA